jgi:2-polyprenyl-6-methoxyphenol hydroxylase-like FAD-dependent oxidoreductase
MQIVVAGAGVAGLAFTAALSASDSEVTVLEGRSSGTAADGGAGIALLPNGLCALRALGVEEEVTDRGYQVKGFAIRDRRGKRLAGSRFADKATGLCLRRSALLGALLGQSAHAEVRFEDSLAAAEDSGPRVRLRTVGGCTRVADLLIGADGLQSTVRRLIDDGVLPRYRGYVEYRGIVPGSAGDLVAREIVEFHGRGVRVGVFGVASDAIGWWATVNEPLAPGPDDAKAMLLERAGELPDVCGELIAAQDPAALLRTPIQDLPALSAFARGRILLLGDAAHAATPDLGQGAGLALEDAVVLGRLLGEPAELQQTVRRYNATRLKRAHAVQRMARSLGSCGQWAGWPAGVRNMSLHLCPTRLLFAQTLALQRYDPVRALA